jgi:branched-chain amino acid transport system substrate-binding protein
MNSTTKYIIGIIIVVIVIAVGYSLKGPSKPVSTEPIKIGFIGPLTGEAASIGESMKNAIAIAIEEINNFGGINNQLLKIIYEDGKCTGKDAANAAQKLINVDKVNFIIGGACSGETLGAAPIAESSKVILISPVSSSPDITDAGDYIFRTFASDASSGNKIAEAVINAGHKNIAVISEQTDYSQALKKVFEDRFEELGGTITISEAYTTNTKDFRTQLAKMKATSPDAMYLVPQTPQSGEILLRQMKEAGITTPKFSNELATIDLLTKSGLSEGIIYAEVSFDENSPLSKEFFDKYITKYEVVDPNTPPIYITSTYDAVNLLKEMIEKYGNDSEAVKKGLYKVNNYAGVSGPLTIDENGDAVIEYGLKMIKDGKSVKVE